MTRHLFAPQPLWVKADDDTPVAGGTLFKPIVALATDFDFEVFGDTAASTPDYSGDLLAADGITPIAATTDADGSTDWMYGPDDVTVMYADTGTGERSPLYAHDQLLSLLVLDIVDLTTRTEDAEAAAEAAAAAAQAAQAAAEAAASGGSGGLDGAALDARFGGATTNLIPDVMVVGVTRDSGGAWPLVRPTAKIVVAVGVAPQPTWLLNDRDVYIGGF